MIVNDDKLKKLINHVTQECYYCPLSYGGGLNSCGKLDSTSCEEMMLEWLQEFDITEALEAEAHIINDQVVFAPTLPSDGFTLGVPCNPNDLCLPSCPWFDKCPLNDE